jgi:hypothetical protein
MRVYLDLHEDFGKACKEASKKLKELKNQMLAPAMTTLWWVYCSVMPTRFLNNVNISTSACATLCVSNIPTFLENTTFFDAPTKTMNSICTANGTLCTVVHILSTFKRITFTLTSDTSQLEDVDDFIAYINRRIEDLGIKYEPSEEGND